jgi:hypothetical protein
MLHGTLTRGLARLHTLAHANITLSRPDSGQAVFLVV